MRNEKRIERILDILNSIWHLVPDWRFLQLILNIFPLDRNPSLFYLEDDSVLEKLESTLNEYMELMNKEKEYSFDEE